MPRISDFFFSSTLGKRGQRIYRRACRIFFASYYRANRVTVVTENDKNFQGRLAATLYLTKHFAKDSTRFLFIHFLTDKEIPIGTKSDTKNFN